MRIAILAENYYEDLELWVPYYRMLEENYIVEIIGSGTSKTYKGKNGYPLKVDLEIKDARVEDFSVIIIPGGFAPDYLRRVPEVVEFVRKAIQLKKIIAAICHGPSLLISAGIPKDTKMTSFFAIKDDVSNAGAEWTDKAVVVDDNFITSRKPDDLPIFCTSIIDQVKRRFPSD
ncbi:MAG: DJ-1/PfpI/YhbO family deglycase/protease [Candidatus Lokiarchaeota archaeon]|nr:DJ-1/PfpI/YhbO family deglycase/protease [Candidatus Lokiarchaeota archaeon]